VRRPARNALTVLLMLPLAAAAVLWMRSFSCYDRLECSPLTDRPGEFRSVEFTLQGSRGVLGVSYVRHDFKQPSSPAPLDASLYTQQYNRVLRQYASEGDHGGWAWKSEPSRELPFEGGFTGRTFREADAVHRGWGVEWTTPYWFVLLVCTLPAGARILSLLHARRKHRGKGLCRSCGYDLTGNVSGTCPECGSPAGTTTA
jgi:hypothetical protein